MSGSIGIQANRVANGRNGDVSSWESPSQPRTSQVSGAAIAEGSLPAAPVNQGEETAVRILGNFPQSSGGSGYEPTHVSNAYSYQDEIAGTNIPTQHIEIMTANWNLGFPRLDDISSITFSAPTTHVEPAASAPLISGRILQSMRRRGVLQPRTQIIDLVVEFLTQRNDHEELDQHQREPSLAMELGGSTSTRSTRSEQDREESGSTNDRSFYHSGQPLLNTNDHFVLIQGVGGVGKTTVAAMVTSRRRLLTHFSDGVCWITLGQRDALQENRRSRSKSRSHSKSRHPMSYQTYVFHLKTISRQMGLTPRPEFEELVLLPGDDETVKAEKAFHLMQNTQQEMSHRLGSKRVLIVLDDVWHEDDMDWFNFGTKFDSKCRVLVTTRMRFPSHGMKTVDLSSLEELEAMDLLFKESGRFSSQDDSAVSESEREAARRIVKGCGYHPLAVRTAGRLMTTPDSDPGNIMSLSDLEKLIDERGMVNIDAERALFDMLHRSFANGMHGQIESSVLELCFSSFSVVFSHDDCLRPWVPFRTIHVLWNALLTDKERRVFEHPGRNVSSILLERMEALGLIDSMTVDRGKDGKETKYYQIHHDMMQQFGLKSALSIRKRISLPSRLVRSLRSHGEGSKRLVLSELHSQLVQGLLQEEKVQNQDMFSLKWRKEKSDDYYVFVYLPLHLMKAEQPKMAEDTLANLDFVRCRCSCMGILKGTEAHVRDVEALHQKLDLDCKGARQKQRISTRKKLAAENSFKAMASHLWNRLDDDVQLYEEVGESFLIMGKALQRQSLWPEAMIMLAEALDCYHRGNVGEDHRTVQMIRERIHASTLPQLALVPRESPSCVRLKHAEQLRSMQEAAIAKTPSVAKESIPLELSSHVGLGIVPLSVEVRSMFMRDRELGIGPAESSTHFEVDKEGHFVRASDGCVLCSSGANEGCQFLLLERKSLKKRIIRRFVISKFVVNTDGGISPEHQPHLAVGVGLPSLCLVSRDSPTRLILKHAALLKCNTLPNVGYDLMPDVEEDKVFGTELLSHPGKAIVKNRTNIKFGSTVSSNRVSIGPIEDAFRFVHDGRRLCDPDSGFVMRVLFSNYRVGAKVLLYRNSRREDTIWEGGGNDFVINDDGSISPMHAPNLAVGSPCFGSTNEIVSREQKSLAEAKAKVQLPAQSKRVVAKEMRIVLRTKLSR